MSLANGLSILFVFSKKQLLVLLIFAIVSFISFSFISDLIFMISFLLLTLRVFCCCCCSSFSNCFRCKVRLFIWVVSCFLRQDCIAINFPLRTAFAASHRFWSSCFHCHLFLGIFWLPLWFLQWSLGYLVVYCLASMCLYILQIFSSNWYLVS